MKIAIAVLTALSILFTGCSVGLKRVGYPPPTPGATSQSKDCKIAIKHQAFFKEEDVLILGTIESYNKGNSMHCDELTIINHFAMDACQMEADIVNIVAEEYPDYFNTNCYSATAYLLRLKDRTAADSLLTDEYYSYENILNRYKMAEPRRRQAMDSAISGILMSIPK